MKFTVPSNELMQHLQACARAISPKSTTAMPVLGSIFFSIEGNVLTLTAADIANRVTTSLEVNNHGENGAFLVAERMILDPIKELADQPIEVSVNSESHDALITYNNGQYSFVVDSADVYPAAPVLEGNIQKVELTAEQLLNGLSATQNATSKDERRPIMTGVHLDIFEDNMVFVASDGHILIKYTDHNIKSNIRTSFCLSDRATALLTKTLLPREDGNVLLSFNHEYAIFELSGYTLSARLLEGRYPNYNSVIPADNPYAITVDRISLFSAIKRVSVFANQASGLIRLEINREQIKISANDVDFSIAAEERVPASCSVEDVNIRIGFDSSMLITMLQNMDSEQVTICLADQTRAGLILPTETPDGIELCGLVIPMKLIGE
ncbi:DNA polymerase III subunit beta [Porphyromonas macacae]|uniref:Beta sliding clamp n=2 Tax=Porphyromonas macacae TaxID=28115 RepID=A0A379DIH6_9PORP|nr:DNA polymerase III subunit beta [Porphyromonas macacae]SUB77807.1 DNA polymerase III subunit beta [Porphyromonas macacae]